jgi:hypothetical protein
VTAVPVPPPAVVLYWIVIPTATGAVQLDVPVTAVMVIDDPVFELNVQVVHVPGDIVNAGKVAAGGVSPTPPVLATVIW